MEHQRRERKKQIVQQKKKSLWADKKTSTTEMPGIWKTAQFEDKGRKNKFLALMGAKKRDKNAEYDPLAPTGDSEDEDEEPVPQVEKKPDPLDAELASFYSDIPKENHFNELERQFMTAAERRETMGRTGLG
eukprot:TRINITY_DN352_c0_g1_i2.p1 TRINITY_DN352_c0_g1~~TRINITY_DN352_c0_g1_i2.p1  ORF type:complete len:132 (-),score=44.74 TRINITY_DN352_c0_g1_i2:72-467(-)